MMTVMPLAGYAKERKLNIHTARTMIGNQLLVASKIGKRWYVLVEESDQRLKELFLDNHTECADYKKAVKYKLDQVREAIRC